MKQETKDLAVRLRAGERVPHGGCELVLSSDDERKPRAWQLAKMSPDGVCLEMTEALDPEEPGLWDPVQTLAAWALGDDSDALCTDDVCMEDAQTG